MHFWFCHKLILCLNFSGGVQSLYVALTVLELSYLDPASLKLKEISLPLPLPSEC